MSKVERRKALVAHPDRIGWARRVAWRNCAALLHLIVTSIIVLDQIDMLGRILKTREQTRPVNLPLAYISEREPVA